MKISQFIKVWTKSVVKIWRNYVFVLQPYHRLYIFSDNSKNRYFCADIDQYLLFWVIIDLIVAKIVTADFKSRNLVFESHTSKFGVDRNGLKFQYMIKICLHFNPLVWAVENCTVGRPNGISKTTFLVWRDCKTDISETDIKVVYTECFWAPPPPPWKCRVLFLEYPGFNFF